jgi:hypothetical protein
VEGEKLRKNTHKKMLEHLFQGLGGVCIHCFPSCIFCWEILPKKRKEQKEGWGFSSSSFYMHNVGSLQVIERMGKTVLLCGDNDG